MTIRFICVPRRISNKEQGMQNGEVLRDFGGDAFFIAAFTEKIIFHFQRSMLGLSILFPKAAGAQPPLNTLRSHRYQIFAPRQLATAHGYTCGSAAIAASADAP